MANEDDQYLNPAELAELSALADGTLDPARRVAVEARIAASPELRACFDREQRVVQLLHAARERDRAPDHLRARIEASRPRTATRTRRRGGLVAAWGTGLAAVIVAVALIVPSGTPGGPTVSQAAALATLGQTDPAPAPDPLDPSARLAQHVDALYFPNWTRVGAGWKAVGQRIDELDHHRVVTVYYAQGGWTVAYSIVAAPPLVSPHGSVVERDQLYLHTLKLHGRNVVTWRQAGHTCMLSGVSVPPATLRALAADGSPSG